MFTRSLFLLLVFIMAGTPGISQKISSWRFNKVIYNYHGHPNPATYTMAGPEVKQMDTRGGELWFYITPNTHKDCKQRFKVKWTFERDMRILEEGQRYNLQVAVGAGDFGGKPLPCYLEGKMWAYDGGIFTVSFIGGATSPLLYPNEFKKYWGPKSQYLFNISISQGIEAKAYEGGSAAKVGTNAGYLFVRDDPHQIGGMDAPHGSFKLSISKGGLFVYDVVYLYDGIFSQPPAIDPLGVQWLVNESGWQGTWNRRGDSNTFDATWRSGNAVITAVMTITISGNLVTVERRNSSDGNDCTYKGTLHDDGKTVSGTYGCTRYPGPYPWAATIVQLEELMIVD